MFGLAGLPLALWLLFLVFQIYLQIFFAAPKKTREQLEAELAETRKQLAGTEEEGVPTKPEPQPEPEPQPKAYSKEAKTSEQLEADPVETQEQLAGVEESVPTKPQPEAEPEPEPQAYSKEAAGP